MPGTRATASLAATLLFFLVGCSDARAILYKGKAKDFRVDRDEATLTPPAQVARGYAPAGAFALQAAIERAARAASRGAFEAAADELESEVLCRRTGVVCERYVAYRFRDSAPLGPAAAATVIDGLLDATYAIGRVGRRGVRIGTFAVGDAASWRKVFQREVDADEFHRTRVVSLMETWIRVWQDMVGVQPVSERTVAYMQATKNSRGWSDVDVLATMLDLGVAVPERRLSDARFPGWAAYAFWVRSNGKPG